jgi:hypothetical protein
MKNIMTKIHCTHCQTPTSEWQGPMESYPSDRSCEAYGYLLDFTGNHRPFSAVSLVTRCMAPMLKRFPDLPDLGAFVREFIEIQEDLGGLVEVQEGIFKNI